ncbi:MAG: hypothetical protein K0V04_15160, partial [Deltaproteobacteria bacterium]|nr:hypothetical protein [Deltaproteobacteria bacterium]
MPRPAKIEKTLDRLSRTATQAIEQLQARGVDHAEVAIGTGRELEVGVRQGEVELVKEAGSSGMSVRVMHDGRVATSSTTDFRPDAMAAFVARTVEM